MCPLRRSSPRRRCGDNGRKPPSRKVQTRWTKVKFVVSVSVAISQAVDRPSRSTNKGNRRSGSLDREALRDELRHASEWRGLARPTVVKIGEPGKTRQHHRPGRRLGDCRHRDSPSLNVGESQPRVIKRVDVVRHSQHDPVVSGDRNRINRLDPSCVPAASGITAARRRTQGRPYRTSWNDGRRCGRQGRGIRRQTLPRARVACRLRTAGEQIRQGVAAGRFEGRPGIVSVLCAVGRYIVEVEGQRLSGGRAEDADAAMAIPPAPGNESTKP